MTQASPQQHIALANVLVATDFSSASQAALLYGLSIVRRYNAALYLAHVVRPDSFHRGDSESARVAIEDAWRHGQRLTTDLLVSGELRGIPHKLLVGQGEIWEGLAPLIQENNVDLLVVGTRGRSGLARMLLGSVAEAIFRQAFCPVLTVGPNSVAPPNHEASHGSILYATDFTPQSLHAMDYAVSLAHRYQARLILLHVLPDAGYEGRNLDDAKERLRRLIPADADPQVESEFVVTAGAPGTCILNVAAETKPDLIVLGVTHPQAGAFAGRRWTVASEVTASVRCPVLTVRSPQ